MKKLSMQQIYERVSGHKEGFSSICASIQAFHTRNPKLDMHSVLFWREYYKTLDDRMNSNHRLQIFLVRQGILLNDSLKNKFLENKCWSH